MATGNENGYPKLARNTVVRRKPRGHYDYKTIHDIVNSCKAVQVSFNTPDKEDPFPAMLPMIGFMASYGNPEATTSDPLDLYIHGYISSRLMRFGATSGGEQEGFPLTIGAFHLDGLVLSLTPNNHSYNYRSAVLHGYASPVTDVDEKLWAMERITNSVVSERWDNTRVPPTKTEMTSTQILKVSIVTASAKIRSGAPSDDRADMKNDELRSRVWTGVVPSWTAFGDPIPSAENRVGTIPAHVQDFVRKENEIRKANAIASVSKEAVGYDH
ncbi:hypothetical protein F5884DRAFT_217453 [Xylogone sp. PMI_703]|nr:hypothetical protein F5884DRAFT_217453 [Xylogone sp. PMI_703]